MAKENNEKKIKTAKESGVAENQKANYSSSSTEEFGWKNKQEQKKTDIKETDNDDKVESGGSDLAGNAAGNTPSEE